MNVPRTESRRGQRCALHSNTASRRTGLSLVEVVVSTLMVGLLMTAAITSVGTATSSHRKTSEVSSARMLGHELMSEILDQAYEDDMTPTFGLEVDELSGTARQLFDDVDDYHGWTSSPPVTADGTEMTNSSRYGRSVTVQFVDPDDVDTVVGSDMGVKRISVTVSFDGEDVFTLRTLRTSSWQRGPYVLNFSVDQPSDDGDLDEDEDVEPGRVRPWLRPDRGRGRGRGPGRRGSLRNGRRRGLSSSAGATTVVLAPIPPSSQSIAASTDTGSMKSERGQLMSVVLTGQSCFHRRGVGGEQYAMGNAYTV